MSDSPASEGIDRPWQEIVKDARRYMFLRRLSARSLSFGVEVNDPKLHYQEVEPGKEVRLYWYPYTPVEFYEANAETLDQAIDEAMATVYGERPVEEGSVQGQKAFTEHDPIASAKEWEKFINSQRVWT